MSKSPAYELTLQFYRWELRGRGWHRFEEPVDLEPAFEPFGGHHLPPSAIIDDSWRPGLIGSLFGQKPKPSPVPPLDNDILAYPDTDDDELTFYTISIPARRGNLNGGMEQFIALLSCERGTISFEIVATPDTLHLQITCRERSAYHLVTLFHTYLPDLGIHETAVDNLADLLERAGAVYTVDFGLAEECMRPIEVYNANTEPLAALFGSMERLRAGEYLAFQVLFSGTQHDWSSSLIAAATDNTGKGSFFVDDPAMPSLAQAKASRQLCAASARLLAFSSTLEQSASLLGTATTALVHATRSPHNALLPLSDEEYDIESRLDDLVCRTSHRVGMLLNTQELATLFHMPAMVLKKLKAATTTKAVPDIAKGHTYVLGSNTHLGRIENVSLDTGTRLRHLHVLGATGSGKSTLLLNLIMQDITRGNGMMVLDPHGDLVNDVLRAIPQNRLRDVVLIDPSSADHAVPFNVLSAHNETERELLASDLVALFRRFSTSWGDQLHSVFSNAVLAFLYNNRGGTLADLRRFLIEPEFRSTLLRTVTDPDISYYWQKEYPLLKTSSIGSILTRLDAFLRPKAIRKMLTQDACLDLAACMDGRKIVLIRLSQGVLGGENSHLLGALFVSKLQQLAMARQARERGSRTPFFCYIDEFHHFITPSLAAMLSGARKYGIGLILAHQDLQQVQAADPELLSSLLANAGTRVCFRLGDADARRLQEGFSSFSAEDLESLGTGEAIVRILSRDNDCNIAVELYPYNGPDTTEAAAGYSRAAYSVSAPEPAAETDTEQMPKDTGEGVHQEQPPRQTREHRYLQNFIKRLAEEQGYVAHLEVPTVTGNGLVDVLLERDGETIAVEVSVSTTAAWELHNVQKCLESGYGRVLVCTDDAKKERQLTERLKELNESDRARVTVCTSVEILSLLAAAPQPQKGERVMKGYRVKVNYGQDASRDGLVRAISTKRITNPK